MDLWYLGIRYCFFYVVLDVGYFVDGCVVVWFKYFKVYDCVL